MDASAHSSSAPSQSSTLSLRSSPHGRIS